MKSLKQNMFFCFLAYIFTWFWIFVYSVGQANLIPVKISKVFINLFGAFGPSIAGIIIIYLYFGKEGIKKTIKSLLNFHINIKWYLIAIFFELVIFAVIVLFSIILNYSNPSITFEILLVSGLNFLYNVIVCSLISGLGEELGWRGFLLPSLQLKFSPLVSSIIISFIVSFWHLKSEPLIELLKGNYLMFSNLFFPDMLQRILISIPVIIFITYLFNKTGGNLLIMVIFHGSSNASYEWIKEIFANNLPNFIMPVFIIILWIIGLAFIPLLIKQKQKFEIFKLNF